MDFEARLQKALQRGKQAGAESAAADAQKALTEEELKRLHARYRLDLSERIEQCLRKLEHHIPGFRFESVVGERGWGAALNRDDVDIDRRSGRRGSLFSRLELTVRPWSEFRVLELSARGTVRNKEALVRSFYQPLAEVDADQFASLVDAWVLEYAELYARAGT